MTLDTMVSLANRDLLSIDNLSAEEINAIVQTALYLKAHRCDENSHSTALSGKSIALIFEKQSLRTNVSFQVAVSELGGRSIYLGPEQIGMGSRESVLDVARVLSRYVDGIVARVYHQATLNEMADYATIPVINALSDEEHPCQALGDLLTIYEKKGGFSGLTLAFFGDAKNNVSRSLMIAADLVGMKYVISAPEEYQPKDGTLATFGATVIEDPREAARVADIIYTDVWASMGQEEEAGTRAEALRGYQVNSDLVKLAKPDVLVMHCMPMHRGEEISADILEKDDGTLTRFYQDIIDQAENRLHAQKALFYLTFRKAPME